MTSLLENYAQLIVSEGVNIQRGQMLVINSPLDCASFARLLSEKAFAVGAADVFIFWNDEQFRKLRLEHAEVGALEDIPQWQRDARLYYVREKGAGVITIAASDPELLKEIDPAKAAAEHRAQAVAMKEYRSYLMGNNARWNVVSVPTPGWATKVFPQLSEAEAMDALQDAIIKACHADGADPIATWKKHTAAMKARIALLNGYRFSALHYTSANGTDLTVGLADEHIWCGGTEDDAQGVPFNPNIPTEEVFTAPHKDRVHGVVKSTKPLLYNGILIDEFSLTFAEGRVVEASAGAGEETLIHLLDTDAGSRRIGEVALVPYHSPINDMGILFYNTLFDENASCHLALGEAYAMTIGGEERSAEALTQKGSNTSLEHVDFMIGAADTAIDGITGAGERVAVFRDGDFVF